jgi:2-(3-amino-3-carboxypropyl)histidine synthase
MRLLSEEARDTSMMGRFLGVSFILLLIIKIKLMRTFSWDKACFHSASLAIVTQKPTFMLDPYFNEYSEINDIAQKLEKKAILSVYKAQDAKTIGIIIGLKEGQFANIKALELKSC